jgi:hypothetical protein
LNVIPIEGVEVSHASFWISLACGIANSPESPKSIEKHQKGLSDTDLDSKTPDSYEIEPIYIPEWLY